MNYKPEWLETIEAQERRDNHIFSRWVGGFSISHLERMQLIDYVQGLNVEIADLKAEIQRNKLTQK